MNKTIATSESINLVTRLYLNKNLISFLVGFCPCSLYKCHNIFTASIDFILFFLSHNLQLNFSNVSRIIDHKNANITFPSLSYSYIISYSILFVNYSIIAYPTILLLKTEGIYPSVLTKSYSRLQNILHYI